MIWINDPLLDQEWVIFFLSIYHICYRSPRLIAQIDEIHS